MDQDKIRLYIENICTLSARLDALRNRVLHHVAKIDKYGTSETYFAILHALVENMELHCDVLEAEAEEAYVISRT